MTIIGIPIAIGFFLALWFIGVLCLLAVTTVLVIERELKKALIPLALLLVLLWPATNFFGLPLDVTGQGALTCYEGNAGCQ